MLVAASLGGVGLGALMMFLLPEAGSVALDSEELIARTDPALLDLAVAIVAGAAGAYVLVRREAIAALPGVAIAVALVPPLTTVGITLELGRSDLADDALLLYLTNLAGIVLAGSATMLLLGVSPPSGGRGHSRRIRLGLASALGAVILVTLPLAEHTRREINDSTDQQDVEDLTRAWGAPAGLQTEADLLGTDEVRVTARGPSPPPPLEPLAAKLAEELGEQVEVNVRYTKQIERTAEATP